MKICNNMTIKFTAYLMNIVLIVSKLSVQQVPYNGIIMGYFRVTKFLRFFFFFSQKRGDYVSWVLIFFRWLCSQKRIKTMRVGGTTRLSLDRSTVRKENLWPKYLTERNKRHLQSDRHTNKKNIFTFRLLNKMTVQNKTMKCLSCLFVMLCHTTLFAIKNLCILNVT